jgi:FtsP/CotA-like multicopper oxidase with cupredoxin domain
MRRPISLGVIGVSLLVLASAAPHWKDLPRIRTHDNERPAGTLIGHVLRVHLEARNALWFPHADDGPSAPMVAFAEAGKTPQIPGPIIRVPAGTEVIASVTNSLPDSTLTVYGLVSRPAPRGDSGVVKIPPGQTREVRFQLDAAGEYYYWATTMGRRFAYRTREDSQLSGAIIVDDPHTQARLDHVLVIGEWSDTLSSEFQSPRERRLLAVNGRSWPYTSRLSTRVGDTVRFRVINTSADVHPMHLHGFYFRVDSRGDGIGDTTYVGSADSAVTERVRPGATASLTWVPERSGNWLFHCHFTTHFAARGPLGVYRESSRHSTNGHSANHALEGMSGLVIGINVKDRRAGDSRARDTVYAKGRHLRLLVRPAGGTEVEPFYAFTLHERGDEPALDTTSRSGQPIILKRGQPVSITVINRTPEPTAVHWHGMELESYFDGVAGFSGSSNRLSPIILPRDSFQAQFTPPRAGTFIYHTHVDELRQEPAGLAGALIVVDPSQYDSATDIPVLITTPRSAQTAARYVLLNGRLPAPPVTLRAGVAHRFRLINITVSRPGISVRIVRDTSLVQWRSLAKDGADLPLAKRVVGPARRLISIGETYDYEVTPDKPGELTLEVRSSAGLLVGSMLLVVK